VKDKILWCLKQKKGITLVDPNELISKDYLKQSLEDFEMVKKSNKKWQVITAYYSCYDALYALLMKVGVKCEIHDCTLALMSYFGFSEDDVLFMQELKMNRINVQYYRKKPSALTIDKVKRFIEKSKLLLINLNDNKIEKIRDRLK
jgi:uncharacterized protein (UPF0332 family)